MFLADDGHFLIRNEPSRFASMFDWVVTEHTVLKKKDVPESVFVKTDYLPRFVRDHFPGLRSPIVLVTGSSDWSPSVNFPQETQILLQSDVVTKWYMLNCLLTHPKVVSYPGGLCHNETSDDLLRSLRATAVKRESTKILCVWRNRTFNVCGNQYITRKKVEEFVKQHPEVFDWVDATLDTEAFYRLLSTYKYVLCPVGNGVDPCPKSYEAMILKTVPIMLKTRNTEEVYADLPALVVDTFDELVNMSTLGEIYDRMSPSLNDDAILTRFTCEHWYSTMMSK